MDITENTREIAATKQLRKDLNGTLQNLRKEMINRDSRERRLSLERLQEAIMWLGMDLKDMGTPNPYPQSYNPESPVVEPTADGLTL